MNPVSLVGLTDFVAQSAAFQQLVTDLAHAAAGASPEGGARLVLALPRAGRLYAAAALYRTLNRSLIYVSASVEASRQAADALAHLTGAEVPRFVEPNTAFYDTVAPVRDIIAQRSAVLAAEMPSSMEMASLPPITVASPRALMHPTLPPAAFKLGTRVVQLDQTLSLDTMLKHWVAVGYENEQVVERIGAFSRRGGIIDVWSPAHPLPIRIELFGNQADSIRYFDPGTQRSGEALKRAVVTPLDIPLAANTATLIDYLGRDGLLVIDDEDELRDAWEALEDKARRERETLAESEGWEEGASSPEPRVPSPVSRVPGSVTTGASDSGLGTRDLEPLLPFIPWSAVAAAPRTCTRVILGQSADGAQIAPHALSLAIKQPPHFAGQLPAAQDYLSAHREFTTVVVSRQAARLADVWSEKHSALAAQYSLEERPTPGVTFVVAGLPGGFLLQANPGLTLLTDAELFGYVKPDSFARGRARKSAPEKAFADWQPGDAVVHEDYGVGLFRGLVKLTVNAPPAIGAAPSAAEREYLLLEFADADRLYVPLHQLDRVQRYVGGEEDKPRLDKLHSGEWEKHKSRARGAAAEIAREMLKLYAAREVSKGHAFSRDTIWQTELESSFPFVETEDQLRAIDAVKEDMQRPTPMDRLVVGDVGYGKTEVALRAAFKAVQDGKQVAVLVPTTVLAQQHWNTFSKRLASFPLNIEMHSRFRSAAEKREIIEKLGKGEIDILIGTHGLVSDRVRFKDLGLLVIDEEHRFGVAAKEKLKQLRTEVDVLTLSATPIPRTLYLGLSGVRAISKIETPPAERLPIISMVGAWDDVVVQQAIRRELDRDGQIFVVHNRIQSIDLLAQKLSRLVPEATMAVAHGQMDERELAKIMTRFADGKIDVLLSTNIIESGLDIPNANTIIIDNADHFGLAELHQLRGRVGRSTIQAYAYFLHDRRARMTSEARERLETLRETGGVGAGYSISMRDLEMRGAGDMLGPKQSGHIASVGFDLYTRLLAHEVGALRAMRDGTPMPAEPPKPIVIDLPLTVGLPESYINDEPLRVQLYRRVASLDSEEQVQAFEEELVDRFGKLPAPALNMTYQVRLKIAAIKLGASSITSDGNRFTIRAEPMERLVPQIRALQRLLGSDALIGRKQVSFLRQGTPEQWKHRLMDVVKKLATMIDALPPVQVSRPPVEFTTDAPVPSPAKPIVQDDDW
jgi:transcription-repair coupling factor (superfamily II helicase)